MTAQRGRRKRGASWKPILMVLGVIVALALVAVICMFVSSSAGQRSERRQTQQALDAQRDATQTAIAAQWTPTPDEPGFFDGILPGEETPNQTPINNNLPLVYKPVPIIGQLTLRQGEPWVDVYNEPGDRARWIGELKKGTTWPVTQSVSLDHYWQLVVVGYIERLDFDSEEGETLCITHSWDHKDNKALCHAHLTNGNSKLVGQIDGGIPVDVFETIVDQSGRVIRYKIRFLVWVPENPKNFND